MRLPWHKAQIPPERLEEAQAACAAAQEHLDEAIARGPEVREVSQTLREIRRKNHIAESLRALLEEGHHAHGR